MSYINQTSIIIKMGVGVLSGGAEVPFSLRNPRVVGSSLSCALAVTGCFPSVYPLSKAMVCSAQSMGHCT